MQQHIEPTEVTEARHRRFASTRWSLVCAAAGAAGQAGQAPSRAALAELCKTYWYPLYAFVRRRGYDAEEALDLTQAFFATLLEKNYLADADRTRGRFRTFLLASLKHFLSNEHDRAARLKRGGGRVPISLDLDDAETRYRREPAHSVTPERLFDRRWALVLLEQILGRVHADYAAAGKAALFDALKGSLTCEPGDAASYARVAASLGISEAAVRVAVHRMRQRYRVRLRETIADSVRNEADIDAEIRDLFAALAVPSPPAPVCA